ncbi:diacylglycerol/lipid kinase family protein [Pseudalkalibacillus berkeleyi]|uniref:Diacylglycerol kinase family lipid kinase n=1 Tax=Pseudalkalibacillus berkeleyi TaxID=1069813 RepID=A0ABS9H2Y8_9BACL|nr:diacylglycerol kinase family protein [Pseudalkalibacillus berkeleyi]MCF6138330.1 diacylglycerol kinase family lipid kinase [Pseudalkalibacillus berkeleyi]
MEKFLIFIINPKAGNDKGERVWKKVKKELMKRDIMYRSFFTQRPGHAKDLAQQMCHMHHENMKGIVSVGGDGTIHEVINGMGQYMNIPVGFISAGSGNDFARGFNLSRSPLHALNYILSSKFERSRSYDLGEFRLSARKHKPNYFSSSIGIGFDGEVAKQTNESKYKGLLNKVGLGSLSYIFTLLNLSFKYKPFTLQIRVDNKRYVFDDVWLIATTNIKYYGGGMKICPEARPNDGQFDICVVHNLSRKKLFFLFGTVFLGLHTKMKEVTLLKGRDIEVIPDKPVTMHADGEVIGTSPISIKVLPKQIKVI